MVDKSEKETKEPKKEVQTEDPKTKIFSLSDEEAKDLTMLNALRSEHELTALLFRKEISNYMKGNVAKRLSLEPGCDIQFDLVEKKIFVTPRPTPEQVEDMITKMKEANGKAGEEHKDEPIKEEELSHDEKK